MGKIIAISAGKVKSQAKTEVGQAYLQKDHGVDGDIHAGPTTKQISLLAWESIELLRSQGTESQPGDFAENIITENIDFSKLAIGDRLKIGEALLEVTEHGKKEWKPGDYSFKGTALMAKTGIFARVLESGWIKPNDEIQIIKKEEY